jgi:hypothetical protein
VPRLQHRCSVRLVLGVGGPLLVLACAPEASALGYTLVVGRLLGGTGPLRRRLSACGDRRPRFNHSCFELGDNRLLMAHPRRPVNSDLDGDRGHNGVR